MLPCGTFNETYAKDMAIVRTRLQWWLLIALLIGILTLPLYASGYIVSTTIATSIVLIAVLGLAIITGYCGQFSLGQAGFLAVGAYTSAILVSRYEVPFLLALLGAGLFTALIGLIFAVPSLRIKGFYLCMVTIGAHFIIVWTIIHLPKLTGGADGMVAPWANIGAFTFDSDTKYFYFVIPITILLTFMAKNIGRTRVGRAFVAIRDNDLAAEVMGINLFRYKLLAFFIGCFFAGIAGSLLAHWTRFVSTENFTFTNSILYVGMIIIGGLSTTLGPILGTIFIRMLDVIVSHISPALQSVFPPSAGAFTTGIAPLLFGLVIILFLIFEPRGLAHRWQLFKSAYRLWPFSY